MTFDGALNALLRLVMPLAVIAAGALALIAVLDRLALNERAAERRALLQRHAELDARALAPGSMLGCLGGGAGEAIESACEKAVFADPQAAAAAVAYTAARLALIKDAARDDLLEAFGGTRRALELDRYGIAAHVLAERDGCTADACAAFALLPDSAALKANLRARAFDNYVARYAAAWNKSGPKETPVAEKQPQGTVPAGVPVAGAPEAAAHPVSSKYDFPSATSIPPVSIMNAEPALPKEAPANAEAAPPAGDGAAPTAKLPVPPKRPQTQAATPPAR